jgi:hypothetical protein
MMNRLAMGFSLMTILGASYGEIYKWTDNQGIVHFSDHPHEGSETVKLPESQTYSPPVAPNSATPEGNNPKKNTETPEDHTYTLLAITQPIDQSTIRNNQGYVAVAAQIEPELVGGDSLQLLFDGAPIGKPQPDLLFQLNGVYRGTHTIAVQVVDKDNEVLNTSESITIYMQRPRVGMATKPLPTGNK